ncbi:MAG: DUF1640 domain-containing protein [Magnetococcales bacterium]|nr:DUF1640 domain-containing protein [Magnetococcales bacterium]
MIAITYDTLKFVRRLKDSGIPEAQAEAISDAFRDAQEARLTELATKGDLQLQKQELQLEIERSKVEIIKWVIGMSGVVVALIKLLPGGH